MMMDKRLLGMVPDSKKFIAGNVACQWISMVANAALVFTLGWLLGQLLEGRPSPLCGRNCPGCSGGAVVCPAGRRPHEPFGLPAGEIHPAPGSI